MTRVLRRRNPGENCTVHGCGSSGRKKGIGILEVVKGERQRPCKLMDEWLGEIKKTTDLDQSFKESMKEIEFSRMRSLLYH